MPLHRMYTDAENMIKYPLPENYDKYLGMPYSTIPCPDGCCDNFVEHFEKPFLGVMDAYGIEIEHKSGFEMYKSGVYNDYIRTALENVVHKERLINSGLHPSLNISIAMVTHSKRILCDHF